MDTRVDEGVLSLINHRHAKYIQCVCGYKIAVNVKHICEASIADMVKLQFIQCVEPCTVCIDWMESKRRWKLYVNQWYQDEDGYYCCSDCRQKCEEYLPKYCDCDWHISREGSPTCNECAKEITSDESAIDRCQHFSDSYADCLQSSP